MRLGFDDGAGFGRGELLLTVTFLLLGACRLWGGEQNLFHDGLLLQELLFLLLLEDLCFKLLLFLQVVFGLGLLCDHDFVHLLHDLLGHKFVFILLVFGLLNHWVLKSLFENWFLLR